MFHSFSIIFLLAAVISVINHRWIKLPSTIGSLVLALVVSGILISSQFVDPVFYHETCSLVQASNFSELLLDMMLSFLLFAGAIHIDLRKLLDQKKSILTFASIGVLVSTALFGFFFYLISDLLHLGLPLMVCMLLGAIVSPTDPIAVLAILKKAGVSETIELKIEGESLFNDGFGVVVFTVILSLVEHSTGASIGQEIGIIFLHEVLGGLLFGLVIGMIMKRLLLLVQDEDQLSIMITIAMITGGYALSETLGVSGLLAIVIAGIYTGHFLNGPEFPQKLKLKINDIWGVLDYSLNVILFVLIGISMHLVEFDGWVVVASLIAIPGMLLARYLSVVVSSFIVRTRSVLQQKMMLLFTWGALRGGISLALVLSLGESPYKSILLTVVFIIVIFSIIVQGLTIGRVANHLTK